MIADEVKQIRADWLWTQDQVRRGNCPSITFAQWWRGLTISDKRLFDPHLTLDEIDEIRREEEAQQAQQEAHAAQAAERHERERREHEQAARALSLAPVVATLPPAPAPAAAAESPAPAPPSAVESAGSLCSLCKERRPKEAFSSAQLKKSAAVRRCKVCLAEEAEAVKAAAEKAAAEKAAAEKAAAEKAAADKAAAEPVRYAARCSLWNGPKGFGFLSPVQHGKELYVNHKALCAACSHEGKQRSLRPGDLVSYALGSNHKGPCAIDVKLVSRAPAHMDEQRNVRSGPPAVLGKKGNRRAASVHV